MKAKLLAAVVASALLAGCATPGYKEYLENVKATNAVLAEAAKGRAEAEKAKYMALAHVANTAADAQTKQMAVMALAVAQSGNGGNNEVRPVAANPPEDQVLKWAALIVPTATNIATGYFGYKTNVTMSNNARDVSVSSYNALTSTATAGFGANSAIANGGFTALSNLGTTLGRPNEITINGNGNGTQLGGGTQTVANRNCNSGASGPAGNGAQGGTGGAGSTGTATVPGTAGGVGGPGGNGGSSGTTGTVNC